METYLSRKYSGLLDVEDVENLFEKLKQKYGSIRKTAERCGVARSTAYGWEKANYVKLITKTKILEASLKDYLMETLGFLTNKSKERTSDLLLTYLSSIYQKAIVEERETFQNLFYQILSARREHFGLIQDTLQDEVSKMMSILTEKAFKFQISFPRDSLDMIKSSYLLEMIPNLTRDIFVERADLSEVANRYNIPPEVPMILENAWKAVMPTFAKTFAQQTTLGVLWVHSRRLFHPAHGVRWGMRAWSQVEELPGKSAESIAMKESAHTYTTKANLETTPQYVS